METMTEVAILERLDEIKALMKIIALKNLKEIEHIVLSTRNKHRIYELCNGDNEMGEIARQVNISNESVRLSIRDFENSGIVITRRRGKNLYPKRVL